MTVCIAAVCEHLGKNRIVLCHDWQETYAALGSSESFDKQRYLGKNWMALVSGDLSKADELCAILYRSLDKDGIDENVALATVREGVFEFKKRLINQFLRGNHGIDFDTLQAEGKNIYPDTLLEQIHRDVGDIDIGVDLIVTGFVESDDYSTGERLLEPCIIRVLGSSNQALDVALHNSFACIGEGGPSASTSLLYREHSDEWGLKRTIYAVYEAKTLAEILPSVGHATTIYVQSADEPLRFINKNGFSQCRKMFTVFGPKKITTTALKEFALSLDDFELDVDGPRRSRPKPSPDASTSDAPATKPSDPHTSEGQQ